MPNDLKKLKRIMRQANYLTNQSPANGNKAYAMRVAWEIEKIREYLRSGLVAFSYAKVNGDCRTALGTTNPLLIPAAAIPKSTDLDLPKERLGLITYYDLDKDAQVAHANIAIVTSNIIGKGPGNSVERDFLAQAFSDFIYAIIIEEMGIGGAILVVFLYIVLLFRTARIANRCENNFPAFLAMGLALLLVVQAVFNMLVAVGLAPVTGQPLPLISKGGTSTIINCAYIGMILSISRSAKRKVSDKQKTDSGETPAVVVA